jgi:hypothetical protein
VSAALDQVGFTVQPRRWVVERIFAQSSSVWLSFRDHLPRQALPTPVLAAHTFPGGL